MKNNVFKIDENGFIEEYYVGNFNDENELESIDGLDDFKDILEHLISVSLPDRMYKPKWNGEHWIEDGEIPEEVPPTEEPPSETDLLRQELANMQDAVDFIIMNY